jgi:hypothetical protein
LCSCQHSSSLPSSSPQAAVNRAPVELLDLWTWWGNALRLGVSTGCR